MREVEDKITKIKFKILLEENLLKESSWIVKISDDFAELFLSDVVSSHYSLVLLADDTGYEKSMLFEDFSISIVEDEINIISNRGGFSLLEIIKNYEIPVDYKEIKMVIDELTSRSKSMNEIIQVVTNLI